MPARAQEPCWTRAIISGTPGIFLFQPSRPILAAAFESPCARADRPGPQCGGRGPRRIWAFCVWRLTPGAHCRGDFHRLCGHGAGGQSFGRALLDAGWSDLGDWDAVWREGSETRWRRGRNRMGPATGDRLPRTRCCRSEAEGLERLVGPGAERTPWSWPWADAVLVADQIAHGAGCEGWRSARLKDKDAPNRPRPVPARPPALGLVRERWSWPAALSGQAHRREPRARP